MKNVPNDEIHILSDFDHTISCREINGKFNTPTLGIFRESKLMPQKSRAARKKLFNYYYPMEKDTSIKPLDKMQLVETWYALANEITRGDKITRDLATRVLEDANIGFRRGSRELLEFFKKKNLNLSVVSGGCSDILASMM